MLQPFTNGITSDTMFSQSTAAQGSLSGVGRVGILQCLSHW